jgi:acetyl-CoA synthetase
LSADKRALRWLGRDGSVRDFSYADLSRATSRFANVLRGLGVGKGERVFALSGRLPELYIAALGTLKNASVFSPLFSAFGPEPIISRMTIGEGAVLITTEALYKRKIAAIRDRLPTLRHVLLIGKGAAPTDVDGTLDLATLMAEASDAFEIPPTDPEDMALLHFTSGTTGRPKGAIHVHGAVVAHHVTGRYALDFHPGDIYWCTADPGWVTGTSYGMFAPWTNGISQVIYEGGFRASAWYSLIERYKVTVWYTAPTAIRMLMKAGEKIATQHDIGSLRHICSVGEPLNPEAVIWGLRVFRQPIHDNWWQTETGAQLIANYAFMGVRPGSMGRPTPGITAAILDGNFTELPPGKEGQLAIKPGWPSMFRTYWNNPELYQSRFQNGWYITGDNAYTDDDGYFWFVGRADDVINTAGHLVGPFEVESTLIEHPAVAEAGVIGKPDPIAMEVVKAFVALKDGYEPTPELRRELMRFTRRKLASAAAPRDIEFIDSLPKTRSGKIMRRLLKARELGLPPGDTSTLEEF